MPEMIIGRPLRRLMACAAAALLLTACQTDGTTPSLAVLKPGSSPHKTGKMIDQAAKPRPETAAAEPAGEPMSQEAQLRQFLRSSSGVIEVPVLETYLNGILDKLVAGWPGRRPPMRVYVSADQVYSAETSAEGAIVMTVETLRQTRIEDEAAFILAHEASHVLLDHARDRAAVNQMTRSTIAMVGMGMQAAAIISGSKSDKQSTAMNLTRGALASEAGMFVTEKLLFPSWNREQEEQADALAIDLMVKAGYSPVGASRSLAVMMKQDEMSAEARQEKIAKADEETHKKIDEANAHGIDIGASLSALLSRAAVDARNAVADVSKGHDSAESREQVALGYAEREYPDFRPNLNEAGWNAAMRVPSTARTLQALNKMDEAIATKDTRQQQRLVREASIREVTGQPVFLIRAAKLDEQRGDTKAQRAKLTQAAAQPLAPMAVFVALMELHMARGETAEALDFADQAAKRFDDPPALMPARIGLRKRMGRDKEITPLVVGCQVVNDPSVTDACVRAGQTGQFASISGS